MDDIDEAKLDKVATLGATKAACVIAVLPRTQHVEAAVLGQEGVLASFYREAQILQRYGIWIERAPVRPVLPSC